ncbi:MAG: DUF2085 domain-containing protein [Chloroflexi bacterium]|nr:DUF2085 domain-containing protein [Chloroflexota bacterium]
MMTLTYYYSTSDSDQTELIDYIKDYCAKNRWFFIDICIDDIPDLSKRFKGSTPVISTEPYLLKSPFTQIDLEIALNSAKEKHERIKEINEGNKVELLKVKNIEKLTLHFSKYYALIISLLMAIFVGVPFLAPVLAKGGYDRPADAIYRVYSVLCHQLAFRSFFIFGEQTYYPRQLALITNAATYEEETGKAATDLTFARRFIGNEQLGYKIAFCERDLAIYGSISLFALIFHFFKNRIKQWPWILWVIISLLPIALDGFSQIPGLSSGWPNWVPIRESTPFLRVVTGTLFGVGTGWYIFPLMEESMKETRNSLEQKIIILKKIIKQQKIQDNG